MCETIPTNGVYIHSASDWPCIVCRPSVEGSSGGILLCLSCAESIAADVVTAEGRSPLPADFAEGPAALSRRAEGWSRIGSWNFHSRG